MSIEVILHLETEAPGIPDLATINEWVNHAANELQDEIPEQQTQVTFCIISEEESAHLNQTYRNKSGPTNVLSFPDQPLPGVESESLGDIAICAAKVAQEATEQNKSLQAHWAHLVIHGFLHILHYDHIEEEEAKVMEALEIELLCGLGYPNPYE